MEIRYWGVRGSVPVPSNNDFSTKKYGGNTICVEVLSSKGDLIILDGGTGLRMLGRDMLQRGFSGLQECRATMLFTHGHWDHIQGFPFFGPAYHKTNTFNIYGYLGSKRSIERYLEMQQAPPNFPVNLKDMGAKFIFHNLEDGSTFNAGDLKITARTLNHPGGSFGFAIEERDSKFVFATDTEHYEDRIDEVLVSLAQNANILVYDAMFTPEEYEGINESSHKGWGHSTFVAGVDLAVEAEVAELVLFHHDPEKNDYRLDLLFRRAQNYLNRKKNRHSRARKVKIRMAVEGLNQII